VTRYSAAPAQSIKSVIWHDSFIYDMTFDSVIYDVTHDSFIWVMTHSWLVTHSYTHHRDILPHLPNRSNVIWHDSFIHDMTHGSVIYDMTHDSVIYDATHDSFIYLSQRYFFFCCTCPCDHMLPQMEEIKLKIITTAKISDKIFTGVPIHIQHVFMGVPNTFSWESPTFQPRFQSSKRSSRYSKDLSGKMTDLEILIFELWAPPLEAVCVLNVFEHIGKYIRSLSCVYIHTEAGLSDINFDGWALCSLNNCDMSHENVFMYVCIYIYRYMYIYVYIHICIYIYI